MQIHQNDITFVFGPKSLNNVLYFTGKEWEQETGTYYFGARRYDPTIGQWLGRDPARQFESPYVYAGNGSNPLGGIDSDGRNYNWLYSSNPFEAFYGSLAYSVGFANSNELNPLPKKAMVKMAEVYRDGALLTLSGIAMFSPEPFSKGLSTKFLLGYAGVKFGYGLLNDNYDDAGKIAVSQFSSIAISSTISTTSLPGKLAVWDLNTALDISLANLENIESSSGGDGGLYDIKKPVEAAADATASY